VREPAVVAREHDGDPNLALVDGATVQTMAPRVGVRSEPRSLQALAAVADR
jgi:hypothetical protein